MKYVLGPIFKAIWRTIVCISVCIHQLYMGFICAVMFLWDPARTIKGWDENRKDLWFSWADSSIFYPPGTPIECYKNPWDALLGKISIKGEHE